MPDSRIEPDQHGQSLRVGLWIFLDLTVIALGAGAFFSGFLLYLMRRKELGAIINTAVVVGFVCYAARTSF